MPALAPNGQEHRLAAGGRSRERHELGHPEPGGVKNLDQGVHAERPQAGLFAEIGAPCFSCRVFDQAIHVGNRQNLWQPSRLARTVDDRGRIVGPRLL